MNVSRQILNLAPSSSDNVDTDTGMTKYKITISYIRFARLTIAINNATPKPTDAIIAGRNKNVFGLTIPLHFHEVGKTLKVVLYSPKISLTDKLDISISAIEYPFIQSPTHALNNALESFVVFPISNISATNFNSESEIKIPNTTTASMASVPRIDKKNFPTIVETSRLFDTMFLMTAEIAKIQHNPMPRRNTHQKIVPTVLSPIINSSKLTSSPR